MRTVLAVCVLALAPALTACDGGSSNATPATTTVAPEPAAGASTPACPPFHGSTVRAASVGQRPIGLLTDASAGEAGCLDEVTFSFQSLGNGTPPGYVVEYQDPPFSDGDPPVGVSLAGGAFLSVTFAPASSYDFTKADVPPTYRGNMFLRYGEHHHLMMVRRFDDGLGTVHWVIALDGKQPFAVDSAADPTRITVYIG
jgi:hypothetical protein